MQKNSSYQILNAIKSDDVTAFSCICEENQNFNLCFGRFCLLSICYLYNAKNILKKFGKELSKITDFVNTEELFVLYQKFKTIAGKNLRLYLNSSEKISPIEILALQGKDEQVKKLFSIYQTEQIIKNLQYIYRQKNQSVLIKNKKISIGPKKWDYSRSKVAKICMLICAVFCVLSAGCWVFSGFTIGNGSVFPYQISTNAQLVSALNSGGNFVLQKNLEIETLSQLSDFNGTFDGNNKTITIKDNNNQSVFGNNHGIIKNVNLIFDATNLELDKSYGFVAHKNYGTIDNVNITFAGQIKTTNNQKNAIYVSGICVKNNGYIKNCIATLNINATSENQGETFVSGCVGENYGTISGFQLAQNSNITSSNIDICGVATNNNKNAIISSCKNYATLSQTSDLSDWSPNVAGINILNHGSITNCTNFAELSVQSTFEQQSTQSVGYVAGISAVNYAKIQHCLSKGDLTIKTKNLSIYAGGICAFSSNNIISNTEMIYSYILNCGVDCNIDAMVENENVVSFVGGISGFCYGFVEDCYSLATFTNAYNQNRNFTGLLVGGVYLSYNIIYITVTNDYVLAQENVPYTVGCGVYNAYYVQITSVNGINSMTAREQIESTEVYWNE